MLNNININPKKQKLIIYIVLAVMILAVYWQVNSFDFVNIDDNIYVTQNNHIQSEITPEAIKWAFCTKYAEFWHPLTWLSLMLDYQFYSLNAGGYHVTNLILHILSTLLLFWLFNRMTGAIWKSAFVAAFFALHPLHVESVAWIAERKDVLSAFFWMLTLCSYVYYVEKPAVRRYLLVVFSFVLALMSKPMVVTLPVIMILLDYWPLRRLESRKENLFLWQLKEKLPLFILSAVFSIITLYAQHNRLVEHFPWSSRLANALVSFVAYLQKTFLPYDLAVYYPFPLQIPLWQVSGAAFLIIVISIFVVQNIKRMPYLFVGWLWYIITILPVIGILQDSDQAMADRYHYLPGIGIGIMLAWGIPYLISKINRQKKLFAAAIFFLAVMSILTWKQCSYWKNSIALSKHAVQVTNNNSIAHKCFADALMLEEGKFQEAIYHYNEAIRIKPGNILIYNNRGLAYARLGRYQYALEDFNKIINLKPDFANAYNNRAFIYFNTGNIASGCLDAKKACANGVCATLEAAQAKGYCR